MLMSIMREYRLGSLKKSQVQDILEAIENFHFAFTAVTSQRSSGGIAQMYALHARELITANSVQDKTNTLNALKAKLKGRRPGYMEFEADFSDIKYSDSFVKQKKLVQYFFG
jgi:hypothetical protein